MEKICPSCNNANSETNNFCTQCGSNLMNVAQRKARLAVLYGEPKGAVFLLKKGRTTLGHDSGNLIVLGDDLISNKHAMITLDDGRYYIHDRQSKNGVFVNGQKITKAEALDDGSVIKLGSTILKFEKTTF